MPCRCADGPAPAQALRILQAMVDVAADGGWLHTTLGVMRLTQMVSQADLGASRRDLGEIEQIVAQADASRRDLGAISARPRVTCAQGTWLDAAHLRDLPGATPEVRPHTPRTDGASIDELLTHPTGPPSTAGPPHFREARDRSPRAAYPRLRRLATRLAARRDGARRPQRTPQSRALAPRRAVHRLG